MSEVNNILLIEDDQGDAALFVGMLEDYGDKKYNIVHLNSVESALEQDIEQNFDIVFLDMGLPGISGLEAIDILYSKSLNVPIVILTGNKDEKIAENAIKMGCQDYLIKGATTGDIIRRSIRYAVDRKEFENKLLKLARYDSLTKVVNREVFYEEVDHALSISGRNNLKMAILFVDLDNFKYINDFHGHIAGDKVLREAAKILKDCIRSHDIVARFGGDEFVILLKGMNSELNDCNTISKRIIEKFNQPMQFGQDNISMGCSIGIATYPQCGKTIDSLVNNAGIAMKLAKEEGKNKYRFYSKILNEKIHENIKVEHLLKQAILNKEIEMHYQPIINAQNNTIEGAEALVRLSSEEGKMISPALFIPIAEKTGLITKLGHLILEKVCEDFKVLKACVEDPFTISINISPMQFKRKNIASEILDMFAEKEISCNNISIEITESLFIDKTDQVLESLNKLKDSGIKIYLDDFGTGYSSLGYLSKIPVDTLKIDRSFVNNITTDHGSQIISKAIIGIANSLNLKVISEGVEDKEQLAYLQNIGCDKIQGYFFSKPMPLGSFVKWAGDNY